MYMYYFLTFKLKTRSGSSLEQMSKESKWLRAENTFLLALDGDIDFQPSALMLLVDLMKRDLGVGAACGRIHPTGSGKNDVFKSQIRSFLIRASVVNPKRGNCVYTVNACMLAFSRACSPCHIGSLLCAIKCH
jgi:hypothetical protein